MSQQQRHETTNLRRSSRTRNRKSYNDYFSDDDMLTQHEDDDNIEEQENNLEEEYQEDASDGEYIQKEQEEPSDNSCHNDSGEEEEQNEASAKDDFNPKFACGLCSNILSDPYVIPACCHRFCCKCIQQSIKDGIGPCPTCRDHSVSFESLRRDEMMGRLLTRYKMLKEKIQKKKIEKRKHQEGSNDDVKGTESRTRKKQKKEASIHEKSSKASSDDLSAQVKSSNGKNVDTTSKSNKRKAKSSNDILTFDERLQCLRDFKKKYGHVNVPKNCRDLSCHEGLGRWCSTLRTIKWGTYKQFANPEFKLTKQRMKILEDMGFRWTSSKTFDEYFQELQAFKERSGHCLVPKEYKENKQLGSWCARIRMMKAGTHPNSGCCKLTPERKKRLDALGFTWRVKPQPLKKVDSKVSESQEKTEITTVVNNNRADESAQVKSSSGKKVDTTSKSNKRKAKSSNDILTFDERLQCLRDFKKKYGHVNVPKDCKDLSCHEGLGRWCCYWRRIRKGNRPNSGNFKLTPDQIKRLDDLGFRWSGWKTFDEYVADLREFKTKHGHCDVPYLYPSLGQWVGKIRRIKLGKMAVQGGPSTKLTKERIAQLEKMGFNWRLF